MNVESNPSLAVTPPLSMGANEYASSTRASVDSDSDYQSSTSTQPTPQQPSQQQFGASPLSISRPLSRSSSTFSALSTTATKDGVEGKKIRRFHDPLGYSNWLKHNNPQTDDDTTTGSTCSDTDSMVDDKTTPPNVPSAPPVTLNEKIRLLRTGSMSGGDHKRTEQEYLPPDEIDCMHADGDDTDRKEEEHNQCSRNSNQ